MTKIDADLTPDEQTKPEINTDPALKLMMRVGIPLALLSVLSLWASSYFGAPGIGLLFFITAPLALLIGFAYNIRFVMLLVRKRRQTQSAAAKASQGTQQSAQKDTEEQEPPHRS
ncbi:MAG: putative lipid-binding transport protein (Tim44 family) [Motiliproteus sp.]|jgi:predicted lipid-binding transport protein (Tim44 family)